MEFYSHPLTILIAAFLGSIVTLTLGGIGWLVKDRITGTPARSLENSRFLATEVERLGKDVHSLEEWKKTQTNADFILKQYEHQIFDFYDSANIAYWVCDKKGNFLEANYTFLDITGVDIEKVQNFNWLDAVCENDREKVSRQWRRFVMNADTRIKLEFSFCHQNRDGRHFKVEVTVKTIYEQDGGIYKITTATKPVQNGL